MKGWAIAGAALALFCGAATAASGIPPDYELPSVKSRSIIPPDYRESVPLKEDQIPDCPPEMTPPQTPPDYAAGGPGEATTLPRKELLPAHEQLTLQDQLDLLQRNQADIDARRAAQRDLKEDKFQPAQPRPCIKR